MSPWRTRTDTGWCCRRGTGPTHSHVRVVSPVPRAALRLTTAPPPPSTGRHPPLPNGVEDDPCHQRRIVVHRHMSAARQPHQPGARNRVLGAHALTGEQQPVPAAPADRHRDVRHIVGEPHSPAGRQGRGESGRVAQRPGLRHHGIGRTAARVGVDGAGQRRTAEGGPGQRLHHRLRQRLCARIHAAQHTEGVTALGPGPKSRGRQCGDRPDGPPAAQLQCQQPAQRVPDHVRAVGAELRERRGEQRQDRVQVVRGATRQRGGGTEARQIERDDLVGRGQDVRHRVPGLEVVTDAVQQHDRFARALAFVRDRERRPVRGCDAGEGDRGGHGNSSGGAVRAVLQGVH
uniref:Integral membrane protein n=1 Tax=Streptomyces auratus AGR0001 TaxID=1160718 RepID=J2A4D3_9ACTN